MTPDTLSVGVRSFSFVLLFQATGAALFAALFHARVSRAMPEIQRVTGGAAVMAIVFVIVHLLIEPARMTGEFIGIADLSMQRMAWTSANAIAHGVQAFGLLVIAIAALSDRERIMLGVIGAVCTVSGFLLTGHTSVHAWRGVLAPLLLLHLLIVSFWFGSLIPLWMAMQRESLHTAGQVLQRFSTLATWLVPLIVVAGLVMALLLAGGIPPFTEPYGALLLVKLGGFALLMVLAGLNKWRLAPAIEAGEAGSVAALARSMWTEWILIGGVLTATAVLTTFFSPNE